MNHPMTPMLEELITATLHRTLLAHNLCTKVTQ